MNGNNLFPGRANLLEVKHLKVSFSVPKGRLHAVRDVSFSLGSGECLCMVGESGCGKSVTVQSMLGILPVPPAHIDGGQAVLRGVDLIGLSARQRRNILGKDIGIIFQDPLASLNPTMTLQDQVAEMLLVHTRLDRSGRRRRVIELLGLVGFPEPVSQLHRYPHELSGGMRQRLMIAIAIACNPEILIADEPTSALDVSIQAQILKLIRQLAQQLGMSTILITHDLGVVAQMAERVAVMYAGKIVEEGLVDVIFYEPKHPYTAALLRAMPRRSSNEPLEYITGSPPDLFSPPPGCSFAGRCLHAMKICHCIEPEEIDFSGGRVSCWLHHDLAERRRCDSGITWSQETLPGRAGL